MKGAGARSEKPVVVVSAHTMALAAVRALGEAGVPVFVLRHDARDMAHVSRHVREAFVVPAPHDEAAFVDAVARHAALFRGAMLLPASDEALWAVSRHRERLARDYVVACPAWPVAQAVLEKRRTYACAAAAGVPIPTTLQPASLEEACQAAARLGYPLLVKPSQSHVFAARFGRKLALVHDDAELVEHFGAALRAGVEVLLQEVVPGDDAEVVNYVAYRCGDRPAVEFTARQLRKAPPRFGSPRAVVSAHVDEVLEPGRRMLAALGFEGFACVELKRDPRDGRYKVLDVNGRPNLSGLLAVRCGVNFPLLQYRHLMYGEPPRAGPAAEGVYWTDLFRDVAYTIRHGLSERHPLGSYVAPYLARHCDATVELSDLRPALARARWAAQALASLPRRAREAASPSPPPRAPGVRAAVAHVMTTPASLHFLRGQLAFMQRRGLELHAVSSPGRLGPFASEPVALHTVRMTREITPLRDLGALYQLWQLLRTLQPDIVHAHTPKGGLLGMLASFLARTPARVYHLRGLPLATATGPRRALLRLTEWTSCRLAHRVIAVSNSLRALALGERLCPPGKIAVMAGGSGNGVNAARFRPQPEPIRLGARGQHRIPPDAIVVGFVGRLAREKGLCELAEAWGALRAELPALHLLLVGAAEPHEAVPAHVTAALRADPRVHFTGVDLDTPRLYAAMDVVALPTYREGFPNVALEAAAMALPIVATRIPGCVDAVLDGITGTLVPARDPRALREALARYAGDALLRARHGQAGRRRALAEFSQERIWEAIAAEYDALLARAGVAGERPPGAPRGVAPPPTMPAAGAEEHG